MQFARAAWRFLVAIKDGMVLIAMLLFFAALYALLSSQPNSAAIRDGALLLDLNGVIVEEPAAPTFEDFLASSADNSPREYRLRDVVHAIDSSVDDDRVKAIVLDLSRSMHSPASIAMTATSSLPMQRTSGSTRWAASSLPGPAATGSTTRA